MTNALEIDSAKLIEKAAMKLKADKVAKPEYISYVKSGAGKERVPQSEDFWYVRCASILRQTYKEGPVGVNRLRTRYGNRVNHSVTRHHHARAGGSIIKDAFDALERIGYLEKTKSGRKITSKGRSFLDKIATDVAKGE